MKIIIFTVSFILFFSCANKKNDTLFEGFVDPPAEAMPFVRWWWNGNHINEEELIRQLGVLKEAGIGGVEINPIAMPEGAKDIGTRPLIWLSKEWNEMLEFASREAQKRGMITDMIVGSGWPFGGEFLEEDETSQRIIINKIPCSGGHRFEDDLAGLYEKAVAALTRSHGSPESYEMVFIRLVPVEISSISEVLDLSDNFKKNNKLILDVPRGEYELVYGILQRGNRKVVHGAPGAAGFVMNHYEGEITLAYLSRLNKISEDTGIPLSELIRALFCDSIELDGANWTDGFEEIFLNAYNYRIEPWFPFIFYDPHKGYPGESYDPDFFEKVRRVRYDYNKLLVEVFLDNFTQEFQDFCTEKGVLCRYQAYGTPFLMGMMKGNMIPDIPESNNWIYSSNMYPEEWEWNQEHGYMIWNLYASSGGHLTGRRIISCEAMTNTRGVFKTSLDEIKQHDDMNFITGINHSVLHGYNYSPPDAGFPGWVRYGAYFSEQNTWWPYFSKWADYNARLSYIFQHSKPVKNIAILGPEGDLWADHGLTRQQFHTEPWYCYRLWESLSQAGSSCDYISREIIREGSCKNGKLNYGQMSYQSVFLCNIQSLEPATALALQEFVANGGKLVMIDHIPDRSLSFQNASLNDSIVINAFLQMQNDHPGRIFLVGRPRSEEDLLPWTKKLLEQINIQHDVVINVPDKNVFQIHKKAGEKDIYFFTNSNRTKPAKIKTAFPTGRKTPWIWDPEKGSRSVYPYEKKRDQLEIELEPLQSILIFFEPKLHGKPEKRLEKPGGNKIIKTESPWDVTFKHVNGNYFERSFEKLTEFGTSFDPQLNTFAGTVCYSTAFTTEKNVCLIELGNVNKGITEVFLNGKRIGLNWYGKPVFKIDKGLEKGENHLEIKYTTVLNNYVMSMENNATAQRWTRGYEKIPVGLEGEIRIYFSE